MDSVKPTAPPSTVKLGPTTADVLFLIFLAAVLGTVIWVGRLIYIEGLKNEVSKANADAWTSWFTQASTERFATGYPLPDCAGNAPTDGTPAVWGKCLVAVTQPGGPLALLRNPFTHEPPALVAKCDPSNKKLAGALVLEKLVNTPPGSPQPQVALPLTEQDLIDQKMQLRVNYCDMGAFPGRAAETEF